MSHWASIMRRSAAGAEKTSCDSPATAAFDAVEAADSRLLQALGELTPEHRAVVVLRFYLDMSEREVAQVMRAPVGTVKWRLHAAKRALRRTLLDSNLQDQLTGQWEA